MRLYSDENTIIIAWAKPLKMLLVIPTLFRRDKCGIMLKVIILTFHIGILWVRKIVPMGRIKGRQPSTLFPD